MIDVVRAAEAARAAGLRLRIVALGDWTRVRLLAEYDAARGCINVDAGALRHLRAERGDAFATAFLEAAVYHELLHRAAPRASERDIRARAGGGEFERALRERVRA